MIKKTLFTLLMASLMFSVQISFIGCEDNSDEESSGPDISGSAEQFTPTNDYKVQARVVGVNLGFGGLSACADVVITKEGEPVNDALVMVNEDTVLHTFTGQGGYNSSISTNDNYVLMISHNGNVIATGSAQLPDSEPVITNLDSGDVHTKDSDLLVEWSDVSGITSYQVTSNNDYNTYASSLLPLNVTSHTIPAEYFPTGGGTVYDIQVNAINGLYPDDDNAFNDDLTIGYDIEGPKGYLIGLTQSTSIEVYVND